MSIRTRLEDAKLLREGGNYEGALTMLLIAVAGTARRRFPQDNERSDRKAFLQFIESDVQPIWEKAVPPSEEPDHAACLSDNSIPPSKIPADLGDILYQFLRNNLIHEDNFLVR